MDIAIGSKIRELRKAKNLTQDELAEKLNVSPQAVSKWEKGSCYPDMAQIPVLANYFSVSLDELFCYDVTQLNAKIDDIIQEAGNYFWNVPDRCEEILKTALREYPDNERLLTELIDLYEAQARSNGITEYFEKAIPLAEKLIEDAKDVFTLCRTKADLVSIYIRLDRYEDAKALAYTLPEMYPYMLRDKMRVSAFHLKGDDRLPWAKDWKLIEIQELYEACDKEGDGYMETEQYDKALESYSQYRRVIEMFMKSDEITEDSYLWCGMQTHHWCSYFKEASALVKLGRTDEAKAKTERAYYIISHAWGDEFHTDNEDFMNPFRKYYTEWGLDAISPCPW